MYLMNMYVLHNMTLKMYSEEIKGQQRLYEWNGMQILSIEAFSKKYLKKNCVTPTIQNN